MSYATHEDMFSSTHFRLPLHWHVIALLLLAVLIVTILFLATASFPRVETATGVVQPAGGILQVVASRPGRVSAVMVREGQWVSKGQSLATVAVEDMDQSGGSAQRTVLNALRAQDARLQSQSALGEKASAALQKQYQAQLNGAVTELAAIDRQIALTQRLVALADAKLVLAARISKRGFVSQHDVNAREEDLLLKRQQLAGFEQARAAKIATVRQLGDLSRQAALEASASRESRESSRAQLTKEVATTTAQGGYTIAAPASGRVTGMALHAGDAVGAQAPLMLIVPPGRVMVARLNVPGNAIAFVRSGQKVNLAFDAFPHARFGTIPATIDSVSLAPSAGAGGPGAASVFLANARLDRSGFRAYGQVQPLRPGMTFAARIIVERRSAAAWLLDPLLAAAS